MTSIAAPMICSVTSFTIISALSAISAVNASPVPLPQRDHLHLLQLLPEEPRPDLTEMRLVVRDDEAMRGVLTDGGCEAALLDLSLHDSRRLLRAVAEA